MDVKEEECFSPTFKELESKEMKVVTVDTAAVMTELMTRWAKEPCFSLLVRHDAVPKNSKTNKNLVKLVMSSKQDCYVKSIAVCFEGDSNVYYIEGYDNLKRLRTELADILMENHPQVVTYDIKLNYQLLCDCFGIDFSVLFQLVNWFDPEVALWLLDPASKRPADLKDAIKSHLFVGKQNFPSTLDTDDDKEELALCAYSLFSLANVLHKKLDNFDLFKTYKTIEVPIRLIIGQMELNGIGFDSDFASEQIEFFDERKRKIKTRIYEVAGRPFKVNSPNEVAGILFNELKLHLKLPEGVKLEDEEDVVTTEENNDKIDIAKVKSDDCPTEAKRVFKGPPNKKHMSTSKEVLQKLSKYCDNPLPQLISKFRSIDYAIKHSIDQVASSAVFSQSHQMHRIYCNCDEWSLTGRVSFNNPNPINIKKEMLMKDVLLEEEIKEGEEKATIGLRKMIIPKKDHVFVAADFSQLELRILAHFANDIDLLKVFEAGGDVLKNIAATWKDKTGEEVTDQERQQVKHIVYGMIYGMGTKHLAQSLDVSEEEAVQFQESFMNRYTGIKQFIEKTIKECSTEGCVKSIYGRRRFLPQINSANLSEKRKAERQAVNTTIQGSAADLVKKATKLVNQMIMDGSNFSDSKLVLQVHDELIYEVSDENKKQFAELLKKCMESVAKGLTVKLPVKVRVGKSWGQLEEFFVDA